MPERSRNVPGLQTASESVSTTDLPGIPNETAGQGPANGDHVVSSAANTRQPSQLDSQSPGEPQSANSGSNSSTVERLLAERRLKLEKQKKEREAAERAERKAKTEARNAAITNDPASTKAKQATWVQQQKERKKENELERQRILRQIEHDKQERKEKEERRKALANAEAGHEEDEDSLDVPGEGRKDTSAQQGSHSAASSQQCALQIRLFDGSTVRKRFTSDQTIAAHVRPWVEEQISGVPFTFKVLLTPLPNRRLEESEETQTLGELGLAPSSTLILVPIQNFKTAFSGTSGPVGRSFASAYNAIASLLGMIWSLLATFLGVGQSPQQQRPGEEPESTGNEKGKGQNPPPSSSSSKIRIRTLHDQRREENKNEFYNGNQVRLKRCSVS